MSKQELDNAIERVGRALFGDHWLGEQSMTEKRRAAIRQMLEIGHRPGQDGNITWEAFKIDVEIRTGLSLRVGVAGD
ncbi:hypothetical protein [Bradyrhizobium sp. th.b2]|uniref:hypothetical protein n=1 Tax=Bradyrhizobium sp. th-b2 TaxID=172088 RepID=UPI000407670B|nr:hypothetical protein [Bradyrhizobium sp. th.b2]